MLSTRTEPLNRPPRAEVTQTSPASTPDWRMPSSQSSAVPARQLSPSTWTAIAISCGVASVGFLAAGLHFTAQVRLGNDRTMLATTALAGIGVLVALSALVARRSEPFGLIGLALGCVATSGFWLALGRHRFGGVV